MLKPDDPSSETGFRLDPSHYHCHLSNFDAKPSLLKVIVDFQQHHIEQRTPAPHLILIGDPGLGKTHLAVALYRWWVYHSNLTDSQYIHVGSFCNEVKASFSDPDQHDPFRDVGRASLLVLDDLFGKEPTKWEMSHVLPRLIDIAYRRDMSLVVTTNFSQDQMLAAFQPHESSRLFKNATIVQMSGESRRL